VSSHDEFTVRVLKRCCPVTAGRHTQGACPVCPKEHEVALNTAPSLTIGGWHHHEISIRPEGTQDATRFLSGEEDWVAVRTNQKAEDMEKVNIRGVDVYYYDNGCNVEEWLKQGHLYGESNYNLLKALKIEDGLIVDAGAHIGTFSVPAMLDLEHVIMIEGAEKNVECLNKTFPYGEVHEAILADSVKKCRFSRDSGPFGWMIEDENGDCQTNTIDNIVGGRHIAAMKLDIEGGEILALDGARETLKESKPPILMEVNGYCLMQHGHRCEDLLKKVREHGYACFVVIDIGERIIVRVNPDDLFPFCNTDVICIHNDVLYNYSFCSSKCVHPEGLTAIAVRMCSVSNDDCKSYFKSIGVGV
jgi:FkbM family methyltransferase